MPGESWRERCDRALRAYPNLTTPPSTAHDIDTLGAMLRDVIRVDAGPAGVGRRRGVDADDQVARSRLRTLLGDDYSMLPFAEAFRVLAGTANRSELEARTGISRTQVHRLLTGLAPTTAEIERVATAFGKQPWYFAEYRTIAVLGVLFEHLSSSPETSMHWVRELGLVS